MYLASSAPNRITVTSHRVWKTNTPVAIHHGITRRLTSRPPHWDLLAPGLGSNSAAISPERGRQPRRLAEDPARGRAICSVITCPLAAVCFAVIPVVGPCFRGRRSAVSTRSREPSAGAGAASPPRRLARAALPSPSPPSSTGRRCTCWACRAAAAEGRGRGHVLRPTGGWWWGRWRHLSCRRVVADSLRAKVV